jgi:MtfA peptidase
LPVVVIAVLTLLGVLWTLTAPLRVMHRRKRLRGHPFPAPWREILKHRVPYVRALPPDLQLRLKKHIQVFIAEKNFIGCAGLVITDEIRVTIAAQACLLILNRPAYYYPNVDQILVYPGPFVVNRIHTDSTGVMHDRSQILSGESWSHGQVILSWQDALEGAAVVDDGINAVIHEFAHQLDQEKGYANGAPYLRRREHYRRWSHVLDEAFNTLQEQVRTQQASLFSHYGATNPAEFFAVISEVFFEQPQRMAAEYPELYRELGGFYNLDPSSW